jgi:hypothetical protein
MCAFEKWHRRLEHRGRFDPDEVVDMESRGRRNHGGGALFSPFDHAVNEEQ